jgi:hypothetical protein
MVTNAGKVLDATSSHKHYRVFLEVMTDPGNICGDFNAVSQTDTGYLLKAELGFLGVVV